LIIHKKFMKSFISIIMLIYVASCSANESVEEGRCKVDLSLEPDLSELVLVGTDVVNIKDFEPYNASLSKNYSSEIGGAILTLSVISESMSVSIKRTFKEPGGVVHVSVYDSVCISNDVFGAQDLFGKIVSEGVLILEKKPNVNGVPIDLWVLYEKDS